MKSCRDCGEVKPLDQFYAHPTAADRHDQKCKECRKAYSLAWHRRGGGIRSKYGLSRQTFLELVLAQDNRCGICGKEFDHSSPDTGPQVDHDHVSGMVRGLLCKSCNSRLGWFERRRARVEAWTVRSGIGQPALASAAY